MSDKFALLLINTLIPFLIFHFRVGIFTVCSSIFLLLH